jgi:hypothetical protein
MLLLLLLLLLLSFSGCKDDARETRSRSGVTAKARAPLRGAVLQEMAAAVRAVAASVLGKQVRREVAICTVGDGVPTHTHWLLVEVAGEGLFLGVAASSLVFMRTNVCFSPLQIRHQANEPR